MGPREPNRDPLVALREGDPAPFEAFVESGARDLVFFFRRLGAPLHLAEDLTQDVFLKLYRHASGYRPEERFGAFCLRVAKNVWIDDARRRAARLPSAPAGDEADEAREPVAESAEPFEEVALQDEARRSRHALRQLPETHRLVFELGVMQELSYAEIGSILEVPVGTVKSRMFHAVRKLRELLGSRP